MGILGLLCRSPQLCSCGSFEVFIGRGCNSPGLSSLILLPGPAYPSLISQHESPREESHAKKTTDRKKVEQHARVGLEAEVFRADASLTADAIARLFDRAVRLIMAPLIEMRDVVVEAGSEATRAHARLCVWACWT